MRAENCKVSVVGFKLLIRVSVDDSEVIVIVFLTYEAAGILAEGAHLVFERAGIADEL